VSVPLSRRSAAPRSIFALLLLAPVAFGIGAALLVGPLPSAPIATAATPVKAPLLLIGIVIALLLGALFVIPNLFGPRLGMGPRVLTSVLMIFLVAILMLIALHFASPGPPPLGSGTGQNATHNPPPPVFGDTGNSSVGFPGGILLPAWVLYVIVAAVAIALGAVAVPFAIGRRESKIRPEKADDPTAGRSALAQALSELDESTLVPRERIIVVYGRLLRRVGARAGDLDRMTAREIEVACRRYLGIGAEAAHELTSLFEEARYSGHEIDESMVGRARAALTVALADLDRTPAGTGP
jgi:Domain of unknown function (DUF4129)